MISVYVKTDVKQQQTREQVAISIIIKNSVTFFYFNFLGIFRNVWISGDYIIWSQENYRFWQKRPIQIRLVVWDL